MSSRHGQHESLTLKREGSGWHPSQGHPGPFSLLSNEPKRLGFPHAIRLAKGLFEYVVFQL